MTWNVLTVTRRLAPVLALILCTVHPARAQVADTMSTTRAGTLPVPQPWASLHLSAGIGAGSVRVATAAARTSITTVHWFRPNVGFGLDVDLATQSEVRFWASGTPAGQDHVGVAAALACRMPLHKPLLFTVTAGGYGGHVDPPSGYPHREPGDSFGALLGFRMAYMGQLGPAEIGPVLALGTTFGGPAFAASATLGLQGGFTVFRRTHRPLSSKWTVAKADASSPDL